MSKQVHGEARPDFYSDAPEFWLIERDGDNRKEHGPFKVILDAHQFYDRLKRGEQK